MDIYDAWQYYSRVKERIELKYEEKRNDLILLIKAIHSDPNEMIDALKPQKMLEGGFVVDTGDMGQIDRFRDKYKTLHKKGGG